MNGKPVTQEWTWALPMMQQTVLIELARGPDTIPKYHPSKFLMRWVRRCILVSALDGRVLSDPYEPVGGSFTGPSLTDKQGDDWRPGMDKLVDEYLRAVDEMPHHFHLHLVHGVEILGYKHPNMTIRRWWEKVYMRFVNDMHMHPETEAELDRRLGDNREGWLERADRATIA